MIDICLSFKEKKSISYAEFKMTMIIWQKLKLHLIGQIYNIYIYTQSSTKK